MAWSEVAGNTTTLTGSGTEDSIIAAQTVAGMYVVAVDLNAIVNGDSGEIRIYTKVRTGATARIIHRFAFSNVPSNPNWQSPPIFVGTGDIAVKIVQDTGTGRAVITTLMCDPGGLEPTTAGRKLDVSAGGEAGLDWANVGSPTTTVGLSGTTVKSATDVETDTQDIQARLPAALTSDGNIKADTLRIGGTLQTAGDVGIKTGFRLSATGVDDVWDEATAGHASAGTTGKALTDAGGAGTPPTVAQIRTEMDDNSTKLAAIVADTNELQTDWANGGRLDLLLDAIKAITDVLISPATIATAVWASVTRILTAGTNLAIPTATENADALLKRDMSAVTGEADRSPLNGFRFLRNKFTRSATTLSVKKEDDSTEAWSATLTEDDTLNPVTSSDPG